MHTQGGIWDMLMQLQLELPAVVARLCKYTTRDTNVTIYESFARTYVVNHYV